MQRRALSPQQTSRNSANAHGSRRFLSVAQALGFAGALGIGFVAGVGCEGSPDASEETNIAALKACHLYDGTVDAHAEIRACDPGDKKKTTICHIPPGNPANAHTLCIGNAAVPAHLHNHGDSLGACAQEQPCPPPTTTGAGGSTGTAGTDGAGGASPPATGGAPGGPAGSGGAPITIG
jgi:hypothetical protein